MKTLIVAIMLMSALPHAHAGLIIFSDREAFELAASSPLAFDGFNDPDLTNVSISSGSGFKLYRTTNSHVSEGLKALSLKEFDSFTVEFDFDVFAFGFDVNELNSNSLSYSDSAGNSIIEALKVKELWNASTFFGVISDTAIRSFTLTGNGDNSQSSTYGFDALSYTAPAAEVPEPSSLLMLILGGILFVKRRFKSPKK